MATRPRTIDEYLAGQDAASRAALQRVRRAILAVAPRAEECISYGMPAFRVNGKLIAGTIRFSARAPLPATLVRKLVQARIAELPD